MKSVDFTDRLWSIATVNRFGRPNGLGHFTCGVSVLGDDTEMAGIYQKRIASKFVHDNLNAVLGTMQLGQNMLSSNTFKRTDNQYNHKIIVRMRHYVPTNPKTVPQQVWRSYFATVLLSWQNLSQSEKDIWNKKNYPAHMTGWNRYASYHLKAHDI